MVETYGEVLRTGPAVRYEGYFAAADRNIEVSAARIEPASQRRPASQRQVSFLLQNITARKELKPWPKETIERVQPALEPVRSSARGSRVARSCFDERTDLS